MVVASGMVSVNVTKNPGLAFRSTGQALGRFVGFGRRSARHSLLLATSLLLPLEAAFAHTVSVGYSSQGGGVVDVWYGTYHAAGSTEGSLTLVGPSVSTTVAFTLLVTTKPSGLVDGTTNFYSNASGTALSGTPVAVSGGGGSFNGNPSSLQTWQGVRFTGISQPGTYTFTYIPIASPSSEWDPINNAILTGTFVLTAQTLGAGFKPLLPTGAPSNVVSVAGGLDNAVNNGATLPATLQSLFNLTPDQLSAALGTLSGEAATGSERGAFTLMNQFLGVMVDPFAGGRDCGGGAGSSQGGGDGCGQALGFAPDRPTNLSGDIALAYASVLKAPPRLASTQRWNVWGSAFGGSSTSNGNAAVGSNGVTTRQYGFAAGADYHFSPDTLVGFALAGSGTNWGLSQGLGGGRSDAFQAGIYGKTSWGPVYVSAGLAFSENWFNTNRSAFGGQLAAKFNGESYGGRLEGGYRFVVPSAVGRFEISPYLAVQAQSFHTPNYSETDLAGGGLALNFNSMNATDTRSELGARLAETVSFSGVPLILRAKLAWAHDWVDNPALSAAFQTLPGSSFVVRGAQIPLDSALVSAGAELRIRSDWSLIGKFDGEFAGSSQTYAGTGTLRHTW